MAVKLGYKTTEMGVIPEEWEVSNLKGVSLKITDGEHVTPRRELNGYYLLSARNVLNGRIDVSDVDYVGVAEYRRMKQRCGPEHGDILISCSGTIGRIAVVPPKFECVLVRSAALVKVDSKLADGIFLQFWLQGEKAQRQIASSVNQGAQPNLFLNHIERLVCPKPPLPEQRAIATALGDLDRLLDGLDRLITKKRDLKLAAMQQLLSGQTRLPGFHCEWEPITLSQLGFAYGGLSGKSKADFDSGNCPFVTFMNVMSNVVIDPAQLGNVRVSSSESQNLVIRGDLLFNGSSETPEEVALCAYVDCDIPDLYLNSFCFGFRLTDRSKTNGSFLAAFFRSSQGREIVKSLAQGSTRYNISKPALTSAVLTLPARDEQDAIWEVLADMDSEITCLHDRIVKTRAIKQGMMQQLLTGKVRLV